MNWYYVNAGQSVGPIAQAEFDGLIATGVIQPDTLVWREGMAAWQPSREVRQAAAPAETGVPPRAGFLPEAEAVCAECGRIFPADSIIRIGGVPICAGCKPRYVQKLSEGVSAAGVVAMEYGGFWIRLLAKILDSIIIGGAAALLISVLAGMLIPLTVRSDQAGVVILVLLTFGLLIFGIAMLFPIWCVVKYGGTPGKRILRLRVVTATGAPISWGRGFGRFFAEMLNNLIPLWIGHIIAAFDSEKRTVHDHIAGTRVIRD